MLPIKCTFLHIHITKYAFYFISVTAWIRFTLTICSYNLYNIYISIESQRYSWKLLADTKMGPISSLIPVKHLTCASILHTKRCQYCYISKTANKGTRHVQCRPILQTLEGTSKDWLVFQSFWLIKLMVEMCEWFDVLEKHINQTSDF